MTIACDNTSVGVIITDTAGRHLLFQRVRPPIGIAPVAGHIDDHGSPEEAAIAEVREEVGLTVTSLALVTAGWRDNVCRRPHGPAGPGHQWTIYRADVTGTLVAEPQETRDPRWYTVDELQHLVDRTIAHARGDVAADEFPSDPWVEPVWVPFLVIAGLVHATAADLVLVDRLTA